jgi:hypothetical protein
MYVVNKENKNILYFAFRVSLVAVNIQVSLFVDIQAQFIVLLVCVAFDCPRLDKLPTEPCALGSTQPLKMSTRDFSWGGEGGRCVRLTTYHPRSTERQENPGP